MYSIKSFPFNETTLCEIAFAIRQSVFVEEQKVNREEEYDEHETVAIHYLIYSGNTPVGTARMRQTAEGVKLERFAILSEHRGKGAGAALVDRVVRDARNFKKKIYLNAQVQAMNVYARAGFIPEGDLFYEAGIPHYRMVLPD